MREGGRGNGSFPVAELFKPMGLKESRAQTRDDASILLNKLGIFFWFMSINYLTSKILKFEGGVS